jgi:cell division septation protein DedD
MQKKKPTRGLMSGRNVAIALVALASSFSFALGYFVGSMGKGAVETVIISPVAEQLSAGPSPAEEAEPIQYPPADEPPAGLAQTPDGAQKVPAAGTANAAAEAPRIVRKEAKSAAPSPGGPGGAVAEKGDIITYKVQVGAFKNPADAEALRKKVQEKGFSAAVFKSAEPGDAAPYKVRVGRTTDREAADALAGELKKALGLGGFVVSDK